MVLVWLVCLGLAVFVFQTLESGALFELIQADCDGSTRYLERRSIIYPSSADIEILYYQSTPIHRSFPARPDAIELADPSKYIKYLQSLPPSSVIESIGLLSQGSSVAVSCVCDVGGFRRLRPAPSIT